MLNPTCARPRPFTIALTASLILMWAAASATAAATGDHGVAAPFELQTLDGDRVSLSDFAGKFVVLHFATSWCPFCAAEAPHLEKLWQEKGPQGVQVLTIDVQESPDTIRAWLRRQPMSFPVLLDPTGEVAASYAPTGVLEDLPRDQVVIAANLIIGPEGRIEYFSLLDTQNFDAKLTTLRARLDQLLGEYD